MKILVQVGYKYLVLYCTVSYYYLLLRTCLLLRTVVLVYLLLRKLRSSPSIKERMVAAAERCIDA